MAKAYWTVFYRSVSNPAALAEYAKIAIPVIEAGGGRVLARGLPTVTFEAGLKERTVIIEFESMEKAVGVYKSKAYEAALKALGNGAERDMRFIEGA
jgi:uncharacterized protein (DUF1330 family)